MSVVHANYSIDRELLTWMGLDLTEGLAEGDNAVRDSQEGNNGWSQKSNGVGGVVQQYNPSTRGTLTLRISMEHPLHLQLKKLHATDRLTRAVVGPLKRQRPSGEIITYDFARIMRDPDEATGTTAGEAEWVFIYATRSPTPADAIANIIGA